MEAISLIDERVTLNKIPYTVTANLFSESDNISIVVRGSARPPVSAITVLYNPDTGSSPARGSHMDHTPVGKIDTYMAEHNGMFGVVPGRKRVVDLTGNQSKNILLGSALEALRHLDPITERFDGDSMRALKEDVRKLHQEVVTDNPDYGASLFMVDPQKTVNLGLLPNDDDRTRFDEWQATVQEKHQI